MEPAEKLLIKKFLILLIFKLFENFESWIFRSSGLKSDNFSKVDPYYGEVYAQIHSPIFCTGFITSHTFDF